MHRDTVSTFPTKDDGDGDGDGDCLWVRETFRVCHGDDPRIEYRAGGVVSTVAAYEINDRGVWEDTDGSVVPGKWQPSIHMPRIGSRITLEITDVRVQRLQEITDEDARAEGVASRDDFRRLWDSINAKRGYGWTTNPWVFAINFKRVQP
jgi:hypothetical protein